jgi:hypothetical protein
MMMNVEQSVEWELTEETEVLRENLTQCRLVHHKSHMTWLGSSPGRRLRKPATNSLSYAKALVADVPSGLSLNPTPRKKKNKRSGDTVIP